EQSIEVNPLQPQSTTYASTGLDGTGNAHFIVESASSNASLGCGITKCALVVIPIAGISCDPQAAGLPIEDRPDDVAAARRSCTAAGHYGPGDVNDTQNNSSTQAQLSVTGALWWSASNWRNRVTIPLSFESAGAACAEAGGKASEDIFGSPYM